MGYNLNTLGVTFVLHISSKRLYVTSGTLVVGNETVKGSCPPPSDGLYTMDLANRTLFFAGIPRSVKTNRYIVILYL